MKTQVWLLSMIVMDNVCQGLLPKGEYHHWQVFFPLKEVFPAVSPLSPMSGWWNQTIWLSFGLVFFRTLNRMLYQKEMNIERNDR